MWHFIDSIIIHACQASKKSTAAGRQTMSLQLIYLEGLITAHISSFASEIIGQDVRPEHVNGDLMDRITQKAKLPPQRLAGFVQA